MKDVLAELSLGPKKLVGQCYDGAANMGGHKAGLAVRVQEGLSHAALYVHCWAHQLNLALTHACSNIDGVRDLFATYANLHTFLMGSPKRKEQFLELLPDHKSLGFQVCQRRDGHPDPEPSIAL